MATATRKRPRTASIKPEDVSTTIAFLEGLPEKEKEDMSLREAIGQMQPTIKDTLARGYSYDDVAKMLSDKGIKISALTLKNYAPSGRRQSSAKPKAKRGRKPAADASMNGASASELATKARSTSNSREGQSKATVPVEPADETPVKPTRGRKPSTAKASPKTATRKRTPPTT